MDVSTLDKDGVFTYEHELAKVNGTDGKPVDISVKIPSQVVGKILKVKKIFSEVDCDDEHQLYFFKKCGCPYLYVMGELFDDYTEAAKDLAGKFRYDADRKNQNERPVMNFSIEGGKMAKEEITVTRSVARKVTITVLPCNKAAIAEIIQVKQSPTGSLDELFKTENIVEIEVFKSENIASQGASSALSGSGPTGNLSNSESIKPMKNPDLQGSNIGRTTSGKDVLSHGRIHAYEGFSEKDHLEAADFHRNAFKTHAKNFKMQQHHAAKAKLHDAASVSARMKANRFKTGLHKTLDAGSGLAAPNQLTGGAALVKENIVTPKKEMIAEHKELVDVLKHPTAKKLQHEASKQSKELKEYKKSKWLARAEEEYQKWEKREQFESFMKSKLPHLTKGEVAAIGQVLALQKSIDMESALLKIAPSIFSKK